MQHECKITVLETDMPSNSNQYPDFQKARREQSIVS